MSNFQTLVVGLVALGALALVILGVIVFSRRDRAALLKRMRFGVFIERDLIKPEELPEWPTPPEELTIHHDDPTEEKRPPRSGAGSP